MPRPLTRAWAADGQPQAPPSLPKAAWLLGTETGVGSLGRFEPHTQPGWSLQSRLSQRAAAPASGRAGPVGRARHPQRPGLTPPPQCAAQEPAVLDSPLQDTPRPQCCAGLTPAHCARGTLRGVGDQIGTAQCQASALPAVPSLMPWRVLVWGAGGALDRESFSLWGLPTEQVTPGPGTSLRGQQRNSIFVGWGTVAVSLES